MAPDKRKDDRDDENPRSPGRRTPGQAEGTVEDVEGGGNKDAVNPGRPSQAEGEDTEKS